MDTLRRSSLVSDTRVPEGLLEFSPQPLGPPESAQLPIRNVWLWYATVGAPVLWAAHFMVMYLLVEVACRWQSKLPLYGATALFLGAVLLCGLISWNYLRYLRHRDGATVPRRVRFMASSGLALSVIFAIVIIGMTLPVVADDPCQVQGQIRSTLFPHF